MLRELKNDLFHLLNILESIGKIGVYSSNISSAEEFLEVNEQMNFNASLSLLTNIGESIAKLSDESKKAISDNDVIGIRALRNRIVHDYQGLDSFIIYDIIIEHLPSIQKQVIAIINTQISAEIFDSEELAVSKDSEYYRHIDFSLFDYFS